MLGYSNVPRPLLPQSPLPGLLREIQGVPRPAETHKAILHCMARPGFKLQFGVDALSLIGWVHLDF